jgi:hypothetical protein
MAIKRNSCRISERKRMREMQAQGYSIPQISNAVSVREHIVSDVLSGVWDAGETQQKQDQVASDIARAGAKEQKKIDDAAAIATATAMAIKGLADAEKAELSPQQRGHITRKENAAKAEEAENAA